MSSARVGSTDQPALFRCVHRLRLDIVVGEQLRGEVGVEMASRQWKPTGCRVVIIALVSVIGSVVQGAEGVGAPSKDAGRVTLPVNG